MIQCIYASHGCLEGRLAMKEIIEAALSIASNFQNIRVWTNPDAQLGNIRSDLPVIMALDMNQQT